MAHVVVAAAGVVTGVGADAWTDGHWVLPTMPSMTTTAGSTYLHFPFAECCCSTDLTDRQLSVMRSRRRPFSLRRPSRQCSVRWSPSATTLSLPDMCDGVRD